MDWQRENPLQLVLSGAILCALSACGTAQSAARPPAQRAPGTHAPGEAATQYSTRVPDGTGMLDDATHTIEHALDAACAPRSLQLRGDPRLLRLASWVAQHVAPDGTMSGPAALDQVARHLGLTEPTPHVELIVTGPTGDVTAQLQSDIAGLIAEHDYSHYGAIALERDGLRVYVVALAFRFLELAELPRSVALGTTITLSGRLTHGFSAPELAVTQPDGQVVRGAPASGEAFVFRIAATSRGVYRVEILGQSRLGIAVVANFPIWVGEPASEQIELTPPDAPVASPEQAAQRLLDLVNSERRTIGLAPLRLQPALSRIAADHVADMLAHGFVGHTSPSSGTASQRVARAGVRTSLVLENIGRGYSLGEVHAGLMQSPGHRGNLLHPQATDVGIAVAIQTESGHRVYLVTELFTRVTPPLPSDAARGLLASINRNRQEHGRQQLQSDPLLEQVAKRAAEGCFGAGADNDATVMASVRSELAKLGPRADRVSALLSLAGSLLDVAQLDALLEPNLTHIGLGLAQGARAETPPNTICAVLLVAQ